MGVLAFDIAILDHDGVWFATTNNAYEPVCRRATGLAGFDALFGPSVAWGYQGSVHTRAPDRHPSLPTDPQAEVLYPGAVSGRHLRRIYVGAADHRHQVRAWGGMPGMLDADVEIAPDRFQGA